MKVKLFILLILVFIAVKAGAQKFTLSDALESAASFHPDIIAAREEVSALRAKVWADISPAKPEIFYEVEGIPPGTNRLSGYDERKLGISQSIEFPLSAFYRVRESRHVVQAADYRLVRVKNRIRKDVKNAYYSLILARQKHELHQSIYRLTQVQLEKTRIRVLSGESTAYDSLRVRVDLADIQNQLAAGEREIDLALRHLILQTGKENSENIEIDNHWDETPVNLEADDLVLYALENHPEILEKKAGIRQIAMQSRSAWSSIIPGFHLKYFQKEHVHNSHRGWGAEIGMRIPLWFFLEDQGRIRNVSHRAVSADMELKSLQLKIEHEVRKALASCLDALNRAANYRESAVKEAEELVRIARRSYEEGEMSALEWTEAIRAKNRIQIGLLEALFELHTARADLEYAAGRILFPAAR